MVNKRRFCHFKMPWRHSDAEPRMTSCARKERNQTYHIIYNIQPWFLAAPLQWWWCVCPSELYVTHRNAAGMLRVVCVDARVVTATDQLGYRTSQRAWTRTRERALERDGQSKNLTASHLSRCTSSRNHGKTTAEPVSTMTAFSSRDQTLERPID